MDVTRPALVLGSAQSPDDVDPVAADLAGFDVARRRSGGGVVLVVPGDVLWIDVILPGTDERWDHDVGRSMHWLGHTWADALRSLDFRPTVHTDAPRVDALARQVCFAGLGAGEVLIGRAKVVGISQRRTRSEAGAGGW